tara:strand:- start:226 stop:429 length:204 start_codon:yes stop_codon:yes gene_type:complete
MTDVNFNTWTGVERMVAYMTGSGITHCALVALLRKEGISQPQALLDKLVESGFLIEGGNTYKVFAWC